MNRQRSHARPTVCFREGHDSNSSREPKHKGGFLMRSANWDLGVITALLQRLETERLPTMLSLKKKVDDGARLSEAEIEDLKRTFVEIQGDGLEPLLERHP